MTTTETDRFPLDALLREQLKAIRNADSAVFRWEEQGGNRYEVTGTLVLSKQVKRTDGFGEDELRVEIPTRVIVSNYGVRDYEEEADYSLTRAVAGTWVLLSTQVTPEWATMARFLKPGDVLVQEWVVDNRNLLLKRAGLTAHELKIRVERPEKDDRIKVYTFMLDATVCQPLGPGGPVTRADTE